MKKSTRYSEKPSVAAFWQESWRLEHWIPAAEQPAASKIDADGWIDWTGGENPAAGRRVDVRFRDGRAHTNQPSENWNWQRNDVQLDHSFDIVAYRLAD